MQRVCKDAFYSEEFYEFLVEYGGNGEAAKEEYGSDCVVPVTYRIAILQKKQEEGAKIPYKESALSNIPKCFGLMDQEALREMGIQKIQQGNLDLRGYGVLIGMVDTGIDYSNPLFYYEDGSSKIVSIWDQSIPDGPSPEHFPYGTQYDRKDIEEALRMERPQERVPSVDRDGHGTFLAGIAAGRDGIFEKIQGAAPDAELVIVKLKEAKKNLKDFYLIPEKARAYAESDLISGVSYLVEVAAKEKKPLVILLGVGSSQGSHTGSLFLSQYLNTIATRRGIAVITAAGNEGNTAHHYHGKVQEMPERIELKVGREEKGFAMELWGQGPYRLQVRLESPTGQMTPWIDAGIRENRRFSFLFEQTQVEVWYMAVDPYSGDQGVFFRLITPAEGIWGIWVAKEQREEKEFDLWLPIAEFLKEDTGFLEPDPFITITEPGNAGNPLTVSAYDWEQDAYALDGSRGYTRNQLIKPELCAPGVRIYGPLLRKQTGIRSGSSVAAALVAGMAADFFQWAVSEKNEYYMTGVGLKQYLIRGAKRDREMSYPNREWGYGKADLLEVFYRIRE